MLRFHLGTTRFTTETYAENQRFRKENGHTCIYGLPVPKPKPVSYTHLTLPTKCSV